MTTACTAITATTLLVNFTEAPFVELFALDTPRFAKRTKRPSVDNVAVTAL
jgi:hypothetical protein